MFSNFAAGETKMPISEHTDTDTHTHTHIYTYVNVLPLCILGKKGYIMDA